MMSIVLTILSLGSRVVLAYTLSAFPILGVNGIWVSVPIGWALADVVGIWYFQKHRKKIAFFYDCFIKYPIKKN